MRKSLLMLALLAVASASLAVVPGSAQQIGSGSAVGAGNRPASFVGGFMPTNIVQKPIDVSGAAKPLNIQSTMMPQQQSNKVFNVSSAFHQMQMPYFHSTVPSTPVVRPGPGNPIQPTKSVQLPPTKVQPTRLFGIIPWY
jgi:hypothetical protein